MIVGFPAKVGRSLTMFIKSVRFFVTGRRQSAFFIYPKIRYNRLENKYETLC